MKISCFTQCFALYESLNESGASHLSTEVIGDMNNVRSKKKLRRIDEFIGHDTVATWTTFERFWSFSSRSRPVPYPKY